MQRAPQPSGRGARIEARLPDTMRRPSKTPSGIATQRQSAAALTAIKIMSKRPKGAGKRAGFSRDSQLRVKLERSARQSA